MTTTKAVKPACTPEGDIDRSLARLQANHAAWCNTSLTSRIALLRKCIDGVLHVAPDWVAAAAQIKGIEQDSTLVGELWLSGPMPIIRNMRLLINALEQGGRPTAPKVMVREDGQTVAQVFPAELADRAMFPGFTADVWVQRGQKPSQGKIYRDPETTQDHDRVALVLAAGNISSIGPMDMVHKLFAENQVVILKANPVNAAIGKYWEQAFAPLIEQGLLAIVYGGADTGRYLCRHDDVDTIHITGSHRTHDAIVWGDTAKEQREHKNAGTPVTDKEITSELGCVTPILVVPGPWSDAELDFQARHIASTVAHNGSFNCNAGQVIITARGWPLRETFLERVEQALADIPSRCAYYPGAQERYDSCLSHYPNASALGKPSQDALPWTFIPNVPAEPGEYILENEVFCGIVADVALDAKDAPDFLTKSVAFANQHVWGTLSCMVVVHPKTRSAYAEGVEDAMGNLRYGSVGVNVWPGVIYGLGSTSWGAYPGHSVDDIQSGRGFVHNTYLFDHPEKSIVQAPFVISPTPVWFAGHRTLDKVGEKLTRYEAKPTMANFASLAAVAMRG